MTVDVARASSDWLTLREPADAQARARGLVDRLLPHLPDGPLTIHDLGCGTGSMRRWLSRLLPQEQLWVEHDRDVDLLARGVTTSQSATGRAVTARTCSCDITRMPAGALDDASLITASALLDMFTEDELTRFVQTCLSTGCPSLLTLSVVGDVTFTPEHPLDARIAAAFNDHQRRTRPHGTLLGPDAVTRASDLFADAGAEVLASASPWILDASQRDLLRAWFDGWVGPAVEQDPALEDAAVAYVRMRHDDIDADRLLVVVQHIDLLVLP